MVRSDMHSPLSLLLRQDRGGVKQEATIKRRVCTNYIHQNDEYFGQEQNDVS